MLRAVNTQLSVAWRLIPRVETNERECWKFLETVYAFAHQRKEETVTVKHVLTHEKSLNKVSSFSPLFYQIFQVILWWKYLTS